MLEVVIASKQLTADSLFLLGEALFEKGEYRRAIAKYEDALQASQLLRHSSSENRGQDRIRLKIAQAHVRIHSPPSRNSNVESSKQALEALESVHHKSAFCWNLMATLYERLGRTKTAIASYQRVLDANPMAIAASIAIIQVAFICIDFGFFNLLNVVANFQLRLKSFRHC